MSDEDKRQNVIRLAFGSDPGHFEEFCRVIEDVIPEGTRVVLRGSAVTGERWNDAAPFDADGPGTSDLDVTLVGKEVVSLFKLTGFFVPGVCRCLQSSRSKRKCEMNIRNSCFRVFVFS